MRRRETLSLWVRAGQSTTRVFLTDSHLDLLRDRFGLSAYGHLCMVASDQTLGLLPKDRVDRVPFLHHATAEIVPSGAGDPAPWVAWFARRAPETVPEGDHYLCFLMGINGFVAFVPSTEEVLATSPAVM